MSETMKNNGAFASELHLAAQLLKISGEHYGNHGCNDFDLVEALGNDVEAARRLAISYHAWNMGIAEADLVIGDQSGDVWETDLLNIPDFALMSYLSTRCEVFALFIPEGKVTP